jgi:hypothetical protein
VGACLAKIRADREQPRTMAGTTDPGTVAASDDGNDARPTAPPPAETVIVHRPMAADDIDGAIAKLEATLSTPGIAPARQARLASDLSNRLADRFASRGDRADLDRAIALAEGGINDVAPGPDGTQPTLSIDEVIARTNLAGLLGERFRLDASDPNLLRAINLQGESVRSFESDHGVRPVLLANLASSLGLSHATFGDPGHLDEAITALEEAVARTDESDPARVDSADDLASLLVRRYLLAGDDADRAIALKLRESVVDATPADAAQRPMRAASLASALALSPVGTTAVGDLNRAVDLAEGAAAAEGSALQAAHLAVLADALFAGEVVAFSGIEALDRVAATAARALNPGVPSTVRATAHVAYVRARLARAMRRGPAAEFASIRTDARMDIVVRRGHRSPAEHTATSPSSKVMWQAHTVTTTLLMMFTGINAIATM